MIVDLLLTVLLLLAILISSLALTSGGLPHGSRNGHHHPS